MCDITKKAQKGHVKGHSLGFLPFIFTNLGHFGTLHQLKSDTFFEFLAKKKAFHFFKRAPGAGTARNKRLKQAWSTI